MADLGPRDRQDVPIWNAIEANNFKQALKLVDKRLAKKPSDYLEALKIYVRSRSTLLSEKFGVLLQIEEVVARKSPIADLEVIDLYDEALEEVLPGNESSWARCIGELRWQSVKAAAKNEDTSLKCFKECLSHGDLDHARQISNSLEKNFPGNRAYIFWNISTMFLYSVSSFCPEAQRRIWGGLALGQISKLALTTQQSEDPTKLPPKSIQTSQEILLLLRITKEYGKTEQLLDYLADPRLGPDSSIAKGEWELWRIRLSLLEKSGKRQELFDLTKSLLERARIKDASGKITEPGMSDWIVWKAFIKSATELPGYKQKPQVLIELESHLDPESGIDKTWRRNASLAWVRFCFETATPFSVIPEADGRGQTLNHIPIVFKYLQKFGDASTAYDDLKPYVERLDPEERTQLLKLVMRYDLWAVTDGKNNAATESKKSLGPLGEDLTTSSKIACAINVYKIRFLLVSALPEYERLRSPIFKPGVESICCPVCGEPCRKFCGPCLKSLAIDSIKSYRSAIDDDGRITKTLLSTDRHPADDFCILAAMCLIKLSLVDDNQNSEPLNASRTTYTIQAILLLEYGWTKSQSNFQYTLLLIRLYTYLGCGSLAMRGYQRLAPKQIQLDTLSYTMFDRISSQHPHDITHVPEGVSPHKPLRELLLKQQKFYRNARGQISKNAWTSFQNGNYNSAFEMNEAADVLSKTLSCLMSVVESRKITRLTEPEVELTSAGHGYDILPANPENISTSFVDTNDYSTFPNFESSDSDSFETLSRFAPKPSIRRYKLGLVAHKLSQIISQPSQEAGERAELLLWLKDHVDSESASKSEINTGYFTRSEQLTKYLDDEITIILREALDKDSWTHEKFQERLESRNDSLNTTLKDHIRLVEDLKSPVPAFWDTLHALYTAYESVRSVIDLSNFMSTQGENVHEAQKFLSNDLCESAHQLLKVVLEKVQVVKKGLDEGGWIDKVLESGLPDEQDGKETGEAVRGLVDENFLEEWAGLVVESWGESSQGLSLLKPLK